MDTAHLDGLVGWVVDLMAALGAPGVGLAIALENVFPPLPSEVFLPLAGFAAARGEMSLVAAIGWTTLGSLVGALVLYGVGAALGRQRMWALADRLPLVELRDVRRAEEWFSRHGAKAVFLGRMVPVVRSLISVPAGVERLSLPLFVLLTTAGSLIWNAAFVLAGYGLGANWAVVEPYVDVASKAVLGLGVVAVAAFVVRRVLARRRARGTGGAAPIGSVGVSGAEHPDLDATVRLPAAPATAAGAPTGAGPRVQAPGPAPAPRSAAQAGRAPGGTLARVPATPAGSAGPRPGTRTHRPADRRPPAPDRGGWS